MTRDVEWFTGERVYVDGAYRRDLWVGVEESSIRAVAEKSPPGARVRAFTDAAIFPGTVNTHTHAFHALLRGLGDDRPLLEWLRDVVYRHAAVLTPDQAYLGAALAFAEMLKNGVTTVVDFFYLNGGGEEYALATIRAAEDVGIRLVLARTFMDWEQAPPTIREDVAQARRGYEALAGAYRAHPTVRVCPAAHSLYAASLPMIEAARQSARDQKVSWHLHVADAVGPERTIREQYGQSTVQRLEAVGLLGADLVAVHAVYVDDADIRRLAERHVAVSHNPSANMFLGDRAAPVAAMLRAGIPVGLGTDGGLDNNTLSIFREMKMAALVQKSVAGDPQAMAAPAIIRMATVEGGRIAEWPVGALRSGHLADFVVIDLGDLGLIPGDRLESHMVYSMSERAVRDVYVGGQPVVRSGKLTRIDEAELRRRVHEGTRGLFAG